MALPKLDRPTITITIPSSKKRMTFKMMSRREEKLLLMAKTSQEPADWMNAVYNTVANCAVDGGVGSLTSFDVEYAFIKIRAASIGAKERVLYRDAADQQQHEVEIDLDAVEVVFPDAPAFIDIGEGAKMSMRWPSAMSFIDPAIAQASDPEEVLDRLVESCIDKVWMGDQTFDASTSSAEDIRSFLETIDIKAWEGIRAWAAGIPHLSYWVEWKNNEGTERKLELRALTDFFSFS